MENKKKYMLFLGGITLGMVITSIMVSFIISKVQLIDKTNQIKVNSSNQQTTEQVTQNQEIKSENNNKIESQKQTKSENKETEKQTKKQEQKQKTSTAASKKEPKEEVQTFEVQDEVVDEIIENEEVYIDSTSQDVLDYFKELDNKIFTEENIKKFTSSVKTSFITITDFIFYGTEINGYTFNDLTEQAKLYVMDIAIKLDSKIESYHPGYKEEIRLKLYDIKEQLTIKYLEVSDKICTEIGEIACAQARNDLETMKENFGLTVDFVKVIARSGLDSLKNWYEIFRESN